MAKPASNQSALNGWINIESINADLLDCSQVRIVLPYLENDAVTDAVAVSEIGQLLQSNFNFGAS